MDVSPASVQGDGDGRVGPLGVELKPEDSLTLCPSGLALSLDRGEAEGDLRAIKLKALCELAEGWLNHLCPEARVGPETDAATSILHLDGDVGLGQVADQSAGVLLPVPGLGVGEHVHPGLDAGTGRSWREKTRGQGALEAEGIQGRGDRGGTTKMGRDWA